MVSRRIHCIRLGIPLFAAACTAGPIAASAGDTFRTHADTMSVAPSAKPRVGEAAVITCRWSAKFHAPGTVKEKTVFEIEPSPKTHVRADFFVKYQAGGKNAVSKSFDSVAKAGYYTKEHPLEGEFKLTWVPVDSGAVLATCVVSGPFDPWQARSKQQLPLWIDPPKHTLGGAAGAPVGATPGLVTPPASLSIEGAAATPTGHCSGTLPRAVAVIRLQLRNAGAELPANRGTAGAKCCAGLLASKPVYLPAIGAGQTVTVDLPVGFTQSVPEAPVYLAKAPKTFTILVEPTNADGFAPPPPRVLTVEFPPAACKKASRDVVPAGDPGRRDP